MSQQLDSERAKKYETPEGFIWLCGACGKTDSNPANSGISYGWNGACFLNNLLYEVKDGTRRIIKTTDC